MKAIFGRAIDDFELREVPIPEMEDTDVLVRVRACGLCGSELRILREEKEFQPLGHEIAGVVEKVGRAVINVSPGDDVVIESGSFNRFSAYARNGEVWRDKSGRTMTKRAAAGYGRGCAEYYVAAAESCIPYSNMGYETASLIEPMGVAYDLVKTADIKLGEHVMVVGTGAIGLMAIRLAKLSGASYICAVNPSGRDARDCVAADWGANEIIHNDKCPVTSHSYPRGGLDKILVTAPPKVIPEYLPLLNICGVLSFIGIGPAGSTVSLDMNLIHANKLQIRGSNASPALYFPACMDLVQTGQIDLIRLYTHTLRLDCYREDYLAYINDRKGAIKAIMVKP